MYQLAFNASHGRQQGRRCPGQASSLDHESGAEECDRRVRVHEQSRRQLVLLSEIAALLSLKNEALTRQELRPMLHGSIDGRPGLVVGDVGSIVDEYLSLP